MAHEKLTDKTVAHLIRGGHGHLIDPDRLHPDHQLLLAAKGVAYHPALLKAKKLDHDAKFLIAAWADEPCKKALRRHDLDSDTKLALSGRMALDKRGYAPSPHDNPVQKRYHEIKRRYEEVKYNLTGNF